MVLLTLKINTKNLVDNAKFLCSKTDAELCAVVKANAYGHGFKCAEFLNDYVGSFAVACGEEAVSLRDYTDRPIYILGPSEDIGDDNVIYCAASERDLSHKRVCIKINSGMNRLGILPENAQRFLDLCLKKGIEVDSLYTHFSDIAYAPIQYNRFISIKTNAKRHVSASNFIKLDKRFHLDMVRCGLGLYGYGDRNLKPVLSAFTEVYNIVDVKKGERIGYSYSAERNMTVAVLGAGYADGIRRGEHVFYIGGKRCKTVGNVCMDMCFVDVSGIKVSAKEKAEYIGEHISGEEVADRNNTIIYEILTSFGLRPRRIYE